jgi:aminoglycoside phosphotransferase (APT) family kinase protein
MTTEPAGEQPLPPKMHADELDLSVPLVRRLLAAQFPQWAGLPIESVRPRGTDNALFRLGNDMVARFPRRPQEVAPLIKERTWLPRLAPLLPLAIPVPLAQGKPGAEYELAWSIYQWLEGETMLAAPLTDLHQAARDLAAFIAALQAIDPTGGPQPTSDSSRGVPLARRDGTTRAAIAALRGEIAVDTVTAAWEEALAAPAWQRPPVWIHGDLDARNLLVKDGRLCAVIDFGCLAVGDPACDVMVAWKLFPSEVRETFRAALAVDEATWLRGCGWALSQALLILSYYTMDTNRTLVVEARRWVAALFADQDVIAY